MAQYSFALAEKVKRCIILLLFTINPQWITHQKNSHDAETFEHVHIYEYIQDQR